MPPLVTVDFVGLDIHAAIVRNVYNNSDDYEKELFILPQYASDLIETGRLGRKSGGGLYKSTLLEDGKKIKLVYDINLKQYRPISKYNFSFVHKMNAFIKNGDYKKAFEALANDRSEEAEICLSFLVNYIIYALNMSEMTSDSIYAADDAMATGFNWCPPLALYEILNDCFDVCKWARRHNIRGLDTDVLSRVKPSQYDYRPFIRVSK